MARKRARRTKVESSVRDYIREEARADREATWRQLASLVRKRLLKEEQSSPLPGARAIQQIAYKARKEPGPSPEDPWSLGVNLPEIPPEAAGDLLAVWKASLLAGRRFTIRQAKWVARVRAALPGAWPELLLKWAILYERRERTAKSGSVPLDTSDLDAELAFQPWQNAPHDRKWALREWDYDQAVQTGTVPLAWQGMPSMRGGIPKALHCFPVPFGFFVSRGCGLLREVGGEGVDQRPWWSQVVSVMAFWLKRISESVKQWEHVEHGAVIDPYGDDEWTRMGRRLAALVIEKATELERWSDSWGVWKDWDGMMRGLRDQVTQRQDATYPHTADWEENEDITRPWEDLRRQWKVKLTDAAFRQEFTEIRKLEDEIRGLEDWARQHCPPPAGLEVWKPTELLKKYGIEIELQSQKKGGKQ